MGRIAASVGAWGLWPPIRAPPASQTPLGGIWAAEGGSYHVFPRICRSAAAGEENEKVILSPMGKNDF